MKKEIVPGITFKQVNFNGMVTVVHIPGDGHTWMELLEFFTYFLRGCGYGVNNEDTSNIIYDELDKDRSDEQ